MYSIHNKKVFNFKRGDLLASESKDTLTEIYKRGAEISCLRYVCLLSSKLCTHRRSLTHTTNQFHSVPNLFAYSYSTVERAMMVSIQILPEFYRISLNIHSYTTLRGVSNSILSIFDYMVTYNNE